MGGQVPDGGVSAAGVVAGYDGDGVGGGPGGGGYEGDRETEPVPADLEPGADEHGEPGDDPQPRPTVQRRDTRQQIQADRMGLVLNEETDPPARLAGPEDEQESPAAAQVLTKPPGRRAHSHLRGG